MPNRSMDEIMNALGDELLIDFDEIARAADVRFRAYKAEDRIELDERAQAACTYCHMVSDADRRFLGHEKVRPFELRGLKLWFFEKSNVVIRFKKMDEDGRSRNYPTKQAKKFDAQLELPGLPIPPVRLTVGYTLDVLGAFMRSQIARPDGKQPVWCGAIVPREARRPGERIWTDVTRQPKLGR